MSRRVRVAIDIGGTFTDATLIDEQTGAASIAKVLSTPADPSVGFMGRDAADAFPPDEDERPRRVVTLDAFRISRLPVTNSRFHGEGDERPVTYVSRAEAEAFCRREGVRLPTEEEWEAVARGGDDRLWPWGDELPDGSRATFAAGIGAPSEPGLHPAGASASGALDMSWMPSRELGERWPGLLAVGGHPAVDMRVPVPTSSPVLRFREKRGKLELVTSSRIRWPARKTCASG